MQILNVNDLSVSFTQYTSGLRQREITVLQGLDLSMNEGEVVAVVGSSGSGKSVLAHAIMGILPVNANVAGTISYKGETLNPAKQAALRGKEIAFIPQSVNFLDPLMRVGTQVRNSVKNGNPAQEQRKVFERYQLAAKIEKLYPFQLSGGTSRRVLVSTATVSGANLVIADEPTPGLHPAVVQETLQQFRELADDGCAVLFITHDIDSALTIADKVAVFYAGTIVEIASTSDFSGDGSKLRHPYSQALWRALPQNDFVPIPGIQPHRDALPEGCLFSPRCVMATSECFSKRPEMQEIRGGIARCIHAS